jgi:hypothetical protein
MKVVELKVYDIRVDDMTETLIVRARVCEGGRGFEVRWLRFKLPVLVSEVLERADIEFKPDRILIQENLCFPSETWA